MRECGGRRPPELNQSAMKSLISSKQLIGVYIYVNLIFQTLHIVLCTEYSHILQDISFPGLYEIPKPRYVTLYSSYTRYVTFYSSYTRYVTFYSSYTRYVALTQVMLDM